VAPTACTSDFSESNNATVTLKTGTLTAGDNVGAIAYIANNGTTPQLRVVKANTATTITVSKKDQGTTFSANDADALGFVPLEDSSVLVWNPHDRTQGNATMPICGVAPGTATTGQYTPVQVGGVGLVKISGNNANQAISVFQPIVPGAAGIGLGANNQAAAPANYYGGGANILPLNAWGTGDAGLAPCLINCFNVI